MKEESASAAKDSFDSDFDKSDGDIEKSEEDDSYSESKNQLRKKKVTFGDRKPRVAAPIKRKSSGED
jgi:hypothetical protein